MQFSMVHFQVVQWLLLLVESLNLDYGWERRKEKVKNVLNNGKVTVLTQMVSYDPFTRDMLPQDFLYQLPFHLV